MLLAKHRYRGEARWSLDGRLLTAGTRLACLLTGPRSDLVAALERASALRGSRQRRMPWRRSMRIRRFGLAA